MRGVEGMNYAIKNYDTIDGGRCMIEFKVHYRLWIFVRATPVRQRLANGGFSLIEPIENGKRMWVTTSGIGFFRLEQA